MEFDLYFVNTYGSFVSKIVYDLQANVLLNYWDSKKQIVKWVERTKPLKKHEKGKLLIDSGAFPVWHRSLPDIDVKEYAKFLNTLGDYYGYAINLDKLPGKKGTILTTQQVKDALVTTKNNYTYLVENTVHPEKILPVFHHTDPISELHELIDSKPPSD